MKFHDNQDFLSLYYEQNIVEIAVGEKNPHVDAAEWKRETKLLGQVATPQLVAELMARWVMSLRPVAVLDPAAGLGGLLHECHRIAPDTQFVGLERNHETLRQAKSAAPEGTKLVLADYLLSDAGQFQGIIANPPYVKAHRLEYSQDAWRGFEERFGTPIDRLTNLYALFLLKIWADLAPNGRAAVLLPAEFLNANFGEEVKRYLQKVMRPAGVVVFTPTLNLFAEALTTSAIIFLEKGRPQSASSLVTKVGAIDDVNMFVTHLLSKPVCGSTLRYSDLKTFYPGDKWLNLLFNGVSPNAPPLFSHKVGDYFDCRRGIATGANDFFCLSKSGLEEHGLDLTHVVPCVTKAAHADGLVFSSEKLRSLAASDRKCYLLNPCHNGPALTEYLKIGERLAIPQRHLPSHRPVWYLPENRAVADVWVAVFSREAAKFILNLSQAKNLTCFHGLYAKPGNKDLAPLVTLFMNSSWGRTSFSRVNRFYGDGLNKLEPKDVEDLPCPKLPLCSSDDAKTLVKHLARMENLSLNERTENADILIAKYIDFPKCAASY